MKKAEPEIRQLVVDAPIQNSPYVEPTKYWQWAGQGKPDLLDGRRAAGYYLREKGTAPTGQRTLGTEETFRELPLVNELRNRVRAWRQDNYRGATPVTQNLLRHWSNPERVAPQKLFFCQLEAAETIIWLVEMNGKPGQGRRLTVPVDEVEDAEGLAKGFTPLRRYACKMATGAGKTVVMGMVAAWSFLNHAHYPKDKRFSDVVLAVCPGLTIKERLQVLRPGSPGNYYEKFDLVPPGEGSLLGTGRVIVTNWHEFLLRDDTGKRGVKKIGPEPDDVATTRALEDLGRGKNLLVFNDEAHHAYRPPALTAEEAEALAAEDQQNLEEATVWVQGLDRINATRGINFCADFSATPFYIAGSKRDQGTPFPWIVSDFGLVDAIESGLVKIPRVPVDDNTGQSIPMYFNLWRWIADKLKVTDPSSAAVGRRGPKPAAVVREVDGALKQLAGLWKETFDRFQREGRTIPPALIAVCDNTNLAQLIYEHISGERTVKTEKGKRRTEYGTGQVFPELLSNDAGYQPTMRIDSKLIREAEAAEDGRSRGAAGDELRRRVSTVGKEGEPGEQVRCVVSVAMLTEGWDAHNVKQILGLRAFDSQLLCEQVVGRGLRRMTYDVNPETGLFTEEYVDVYGVPFEVIPVKEVPEHGAAEEKDRTIVHAREDRKALAIEFPLVEGYVCEVREHIRADLARVEPVKIDPQLDPTAVFARAKAWAEGGAPGLEGVGETVEQTREEYYRTVRPQSIAYDIARRVTEGLVGGQGQEGKTAFRHRAAHHLFPQVLAIVREFLQAKVDYNGVDEREVGLERYREQVEERLLAVIEPDTEGGEAALLPRLDRFRRKGSTGDVLFSTTRECRDTLKSHVSHVVLDAPVWEGSAAFELERSGDVTAYARNDHLGFLIPYEWEDDRHLYTPDYLVRLRNGLLLILEIKGREWEQDRQKYAAARRWVSAVNNAGEWGRWEFAVCKEPAELRGMLAELATAPAMSAR